MKELTPKDILSIYNEEDKYIVILESDNKNKGILDNIKENNKELYIKFFYFFNIFIKKGCDIYERYKYQ